MGSHAAPGGVLTPQRSGPGCGAGRSRGARAGGQRQVERHCRAERSFDDHRGARRAASGSSTAEIPRWPRRDQATFWRASLPAGSPGGCSRSRPRCSASRCMPTWEARGASEGVVSRRGPRAPGLPRALDMKPPSCASRRTRSSTTTRSAGESPQAFRPPPGYRSASLARHGREAARARLTFLPLLVVALGLSSFSGSSRSPVDRASIAGWQVTLRVDPYGDRLIVGVTFIARTDHHHPGRPLLPKRRPGFSSPGRASRCAWRGCSKNRP